MNTLIGEINPLGREDLHEADCNIMIYNYIYDMCMYYFHSELKHLINYEKRNKLDTVSSGERMRCKA